MHTHCTDSTALPHSTLQQPCASAGFAFAAPPLQYLLSLPHFQRFLLLLPILLLLLLLTWSPLAAPPIGVDLALACCSKKLTSSWGDQSVK
jgi:hypothetical protein